MRVSAFLDSLNVEQLMALRTMLNQSRARIRISSSTGRS
jgi:hypothetical protein